MYYGGMHTQYVTRSELDQEQLVTRVEACKLLSISRMCLIGLENKGHFNKVTMGSKPRDRCDSPKSKLSSEPTSKLWWTEIANPPNERRNE